jgi:hypothetical protein
MNATRQHQVWPTRTARRSPSKTMAGASRSIGIQRRRRARLRSSSPAHAGGKLMEPTTDGGWPPRCRRQRGQRVVRLVATVKRDGAQWNALQTEAVVAPPDPARKRHHGVFRPDFGRSPRWSSTPRSSAAGVGSYLHPGLKVVFEDDDKTRSLFEHTEGLADYLRRSSRNAALPIHETPFAQQERGPARRPLRFNDGGHRRADPVGVNGVPTGSGRTRTACGPASARQSATSSRRTTCRPRASR